MDIAITFSLAGSRCWRPWKRSRLARIDRSPDPRCSSRARFRLPFSGLDPLFAASLRWPRRECSQLGRSTPGATTKCRFDPACSGRHFRNGCACTSDMRTRFSAYPISFWRPCRSAQSLFYRQLEVATGFSDENFSVVDGTDFLKHTEDLAKSRPMFRMMRLIGERGFKLEPRIGTQMEQAARSRNPVTARSRDSAFSAGILQLPH